MTLESKAQERARYSKDFKRKVAKSYLLEKCSYSSLAKRHKLKNGRVVSGFVTWYLSEMKKENEEALTPLKGLEELSEQAQIELLQKHLKATSLRAEALETMIDIAEKELNIPIRKKSGAKQSKK